MNPEHLALVEFAMRRVIEARPRPSSVTYKQAAEMLGVTSKNVDDMKANSKNAEVRRLLGAEGKRQARAAGRGTRP